VVTCIGRWADEGLHVANIQIGGTIPVDGVEVGVVNVVVKIIVFGEFVLKAGEIILEVHRILQDAEHDLLGVVRAGDGTRLLACLAQGGQQHGRQDGDNSDDNQKFNQGEVFFHGKSPYFKEYRLIVSR